MVWRKKPKTRSAVAAGRQKPWAAKVNEMARDRQPVELIQGSKQQETIWDAWLNSTAHLSIQALAGTGKTTTVIQGFHRMGQEKSGRSAFVAFNRSIARELQTKVPSWVEASTFHSLLNKSIYKAYGRIKLDNYKTSFLLEEMVGEKAFDKMQVTTKIAVESLVGLVKNTLTNPDDAGLDFLVDRYGVQVNGDEAEVYDFVREIIEKSKTDVSIYDFDDMIWLPVVNNLPIEKFDTLAVDEAQDLNAVQQAAIVRMQARTIIVGDRNQAIYGFRGSDVESMDTMTMLLEQSGRDVKVLPLTQTRRCPKVHVARAQAIVPDFEALPEAPEGSLEEKELEAAVEEMGPGDLVVCRLNAPVVSTAFRLLKLGKRANIQGRDLGKGLKAMIRKLKVKSGEGSVGQMLVKLQSYVANEVAKLQKLKRVPENKITTLEDKYSCILSFCDGVDNLDQVYERIDTMFTEAEPGQKSNFVLLSTVHRAKGLEADTVWVLFPELMPFPKAKLDWEKVQEHNILYVALTRSKERLVLVRKPVKEEDQ